MLQIAKHHKSVCLAQPTVDRRLISVYGDTVHRNDGRHLHGGVEGDEAMFKLYDRVVSYPHPLYSPPAKGLVGTRFLYLLALEFARVRRRETILERPLIFPAVILRKEKGVHRARDIKRRLSRRMDLWEAGEIAAPWRRLGGAWGGLGRQETRSLQPSDFTLQ